MKKVFSLLFAAALFFLSAAATHAEIREIKSPTFSAPAFVMPGGNVNIVLEVPAPGTAKSAALITLDGAAAATVPLSMELISGPNDIPLAIPETVAPALYDLCVTFSAPDEKTDCQPHSVAVKSSMSPPFTFGHITDFHIGDPRAETQFPGVNIDKVRTKALETMNERNPDFVLFTGDICAYPETYEEDYPTAVEKIISTLKVPAVIVPGNHDLYAKTDMDGNLEAEGMDYWARYFGPLHQAFNYGPFRFLCFNTYGWDQATRNRNRPYHNKMGTSHTYQGALTPGEYKWIIEQFKAMDGRTPILSSHHSPNTFEAMPMQWCGDCIPPTKFKALVKKANVPYYIFGHIHRNEDTVEGGTRYISTTSTGSDVAPDELWGVRIFHVKESLAMDPELITLFKEPPMLENQD